MSTRLLTAAFAALIALAGCHESTSAPREIAEARSVPSPPALVRSTAERFGPAEQAFHDGPAASPRYGWSRPEGWTELAPGGMGLAGFCVDRNPQAACSLVLLHGDGGGLAANVNRWRRQMGLEDMTEEAIGELPRIPVLGASAVLVEVSGLFTDTSGVSHPDFALLGMVCPIREGTLFAKLTGPEVTVHEERDRFIAFCGSLTRAER